MVHFVKKNMTAFWDVSLMPPSSGFALFSGGTRGALCPPDPRKNNGSPDAVWGNDQPLGLPSNQKAEAASAYGLTGLLIEESSKRPLLAD